MVSRFEPENNLAMIVDGYRLSGASLPLIVVGSARYASAYREQVVGSAGPNVRFLGAVWDQVLIDQLYGNCASYIHGHSVGGTNPSLLRAMGAGAPVSAYDVVFNRETAGPAAGYFVDARGVASLIAADESDPVGAMARGDEGRRRAARRYVWDDVAGEYERLCQRLIEHRDALGIRRRTRSSTHGQACSSGLPWVCFPGTGSARLEPCPERHVERAFRPPAGLAARHLSALLLSREADRHPVRRRQRRPHPARCRKRSDCADRSVRFTAVRHRSRRRQSIRRSLHRPAASRASRCPSRTQPSMLPSRSRSWSTCHRRSGRA